MHAQLQLLSHLANVVGSTQESQGDFILWEVARQARCIVLGDSREVNKPILGGFPHARCHPRILTSAGQSQLDHAGALGGVHVRLQPPDLSLHVAIV